MDGSRSRPLPGDVAGFTAGGSAQIQLDPFVELRYSRATHQGILTTGETWLGGMVHEVTDDVVVPDGLTLLIQAGAVVKLHPGRQIVVRHGGQLDAFGSLAQPVVFTSLSDDTAGGDTNRDGVLTVPSPGDWRWILVDGGTLNLDYAEVRYAGGVRSPGWAGDTAVFAPSSFSVVNISNSSIRDPFWAGVYAGFGTAVNITNSLITGADRALFLDGTALIVNTTLDANASGISGHGNGNVRLVNSIISNYTLWGIEVWVSAQNSNVWTPAGTGASAYGNDQTGINGNMSVDPMYKDVTRRDYRLRYQSPMIDAAHGPSARQRTSWARRAMTIRAPPTREPPPAPASMPTSGRSSSSKPPPPTRISS